MKIPHGQYYIKNKIESTHLSLHDGVIQYKYVGYLTFIFFNIMKK